MSVVQNPTSSAYFKQGVNSGPVYCSPEMFVQLTNHLENSPTIGSAAQQQVSTFTHQTRLSRRVITDNILHVTQASVGEIFATLRVSTFTVGSAGEPVRSSRATSPSRLICKPSRCPTILYLGHLITSRRAPKWRYCRHITTLKLHL